MWGLVCGVSFDAKWISPQCVITGLLFGELIGLKIFVFPVFGFANLSTNTFITVCQAKLISWKTNINSLPNLHFGAQVDDSY